MARRWPIVGVGLAVLWLFVRGVALTPDGLLAGTVTGLLFGFPVAYLLRGFYTPTVDVAGRVRAIPHAVAFLGLFTKELVKANFDVAYRVLAPSMPIHPAVVEVPLRVETDFGITTIANSITLTPGTLTMDYDEETNTLFVHTISGENRDAVVAPIRTWEDHVLLMFDEDSDPGDPAPPRPSARADGSATADGRDGSATADGRDGSATADGTEGGDRDG